MHITKPARVVALATAGIVIVGVADIARATLSSHVAGSVKQLLVKSSTDPFATESTSFTGVPGTQTQVNVATGATMLLDIRYTAESVCVQPNQVTNGYCSVTIVVDGVQAEPASGSDFAFDSTDKGREGPGSLEGHAMERSLVVGQGAHVVQVLARVVNGATQFQLDDWHLAIDVASIP
jgi:hypothetical protein